MSWYEIQHPIQSDTYKYTQPKNYTHFSITPHRKRITFIVTRFYTTPNSAVQSEFWLYDHNFSRNFGGKLMAHSWILSPIPNNIFSRLQLISCFERKHISAHRNLETHIAIVTLHPQQPCYLLVLLCERGSTQAE